MNPHPPNKLKTVNQQKTLRCHRNKFPGQGESLKKPEPIKKNQQSVSLKSKSYNTAIVNDVTPVHKGSSDSSLERGYQRSNSFSRYKPLPSIATLKSNDCSNSRKSSSAPVKLKDNKTMKKSTSSNKRVVYPNGTLEETPSQSMRDDLVLKSMKKMKLTFDQTESHQRTATNSTPNTPLTPAYPINLIIRTLNGDKVQHIFSSHHTLADIFSFLSHSLNVNINARQHVLYTSEVPKRQLDDVNINLENLGIKDRSVLLLDVR